MRKSSIAKRSAAAALCRASWGSPLLGRRWAGLCLGTYATVMAEQDAAKAAINARELCHLVMPPGTAFLHATAVYLRYQGRLVVARLQGLPVLLGREALLSAHAYPDSSVSSQPEPALVLGSRTGQSSHTVPQGRRQSVTQIRSPTVS